MSTFRILSLDGGGIRGIYTAVLLDAICQAVPDFLGSIDLFAGTSTGGIIALCLARGLAPAEGVHLYRKFGKEVFRDSLLDDLVDLGTLIGAQYSHRRLKQVLQHVLGDTTLEALHARGKFVLVPTFDLDAVKNGERSWKPKFFHNFPGPDSDGHELAVDVALRTSAAPTYFPSYQGYIDGGVVANNPSMAALAQALCHQPDEIGPKEIRLLSVGTGYFPRYIDGKSHNWGYGQWARPLLPLMLEGSMGVADYQCLSILTKERYHRLNARLPVPVNLDDAGQIEVLVKAAQSEEEKLAETIAWVEQKYLR